MPAPSNPPLVVAAEMGYGHLRSAWSLADALGTDVLRFDAPPVAKPDEVRTWDRARWLYEFASRASQVPFVGRPFGMALDAATKIEPLRTGQRRPRPPRSVHTLHRLCREGLCGGLLDRLRTSGRPLLTTFYAPAVAADMAGLGDISCVVTDSDIHRVWAPLVSTRTRIRYFVPSDRARERLVSYGVPRGNVEHTGFPLPPELTEVDRLRSDLSARIRRLEQKDAEPPLVTFAVGGAGAQTNVLRRALPGLGELLERREIRLALVAGVREKVAARFKDWLHDAKLDHYLGKSIEVLRKQEFRDYYLAFNALLSRTDVLWTKPSELVFYAALGLPLLLAPPVGCQERCNQRWAMDRGVALEQGGPRDLASFLREKLDDGSLAEATRSGCGRLPSDGTRNILRSALS